MWVGGQENVVTPFGLVVIYFLGGPLSSCDGTKKEPGYGQVRGAGILDKSCSGVS